MGGYDVIGDVHGQVGRLELLLTQMDYRVSRGAWRHPDGRVAVFVGDLIDRRRDHQLATLRVVRSMVEAGSAKVVLGNHEFNAVAYATVHPVQFDYCREHSSKHWRQHREFLEEVEFGSPLHRSVIDWFRSLPLWLDLGGVRVVHACWSEPDLEHLRGILTADGALTDQAIVDGATPGNRTYEAIEVVLKGPEIWMGGAYYFDKDGNRRDKARLRWWDRSAATLRAAADIPGGTQLHAADGTAIDALPDTALAEAADYRYTGTVPVIYGHYWRTGKLRVDGSRDALTACVDYSAGKGDPLAAYRWSPDQTRLMAEHLIAA